MSNIPTRAQKAKQQKAETEASSDDETSKLAETAPITQQEEPKKFNLAGKYRVREGYSVAHGSRHGDTEHSVGHHARAKAGELVYLSHEDAVSIIKQTKDQKDPGTGRPNGPAIETEAVYNQRQAAENERLEFEKNLAGSIPV